MAKQTDWRGVLADAKEEFSKIDGCLGVNFCEKRKGGKVTGENAIVVYVRKKIPDVKQIPKDQLIPSEFEGIATDVVELFSKDRERRHLDYIKDHYRSHDLAAMDFAELNRAHLEQAGALPDIQKTGVVGEVFVMEDSDGRLTTVENGEEIPDLVEAYKVFRQQNGDEFDFVTFFCDGPSGFPTFDTSFHWGIFNDIQGIGRPLYDYRDVLGGSDKLQSIHFMHHTHFNRYVILQEVGHRWGAFVGFKESAGGPVKYDLLIQSGAGAYSHWDILFDDDLSPLDYDVIDWIANPDGTFSYQNIPNQNRAYCNLDLYLMGLIPSGQVGSFYFLRNIQNLGGQRFSAEKKQVQLQNIIFAEGDRRPTASEAQKLFKQAFVLLTRNYDLAASLGQTIDRFRQEYTAAFAEATNNLATVETTLGGELPLMGGYISQEYHRQLLIPEKMVGQLPSPVQSSLSFLEDDEVKDLEVSLDITHTYVADLKIILINPDNSEVVLHDREGGGADDLKKLYTVANTPDLNSFIGKKAQGTWTLKISDLAEADSGKLNSWSIKIGFNGQEETETGDEIKLGIYRVDPSSPDDSPRTMELHKRRSQALHEALEHVDGWQVKEWGDTDDEKPHEVIELTLAVIASAQFKAVAVPALMFVGGLLVKEAVSVVTSEAVKTLITRLWPKQKDEKIYDFGIQFPGGQRIQCDPKGKDMDIRVTLKNGDQYSVRYNAKEQEIERQTETP